MATSQLSLFSYYPEALHSPTATVHLEYDPAALPPKPSEDWTRFVCISDTHAHTFDVPDGDVLLHSGDLTNTGKVADFKKTTDWLYSLPHKFKIIIAGNHDLTLHTDWYAKENARWHRGAGKQDILPILEMLKGRRAADAGIVYLQDEEYKFKLREGGKEWSVYGSPWSPEFCDWAFNYERSEADAIISKFPKTDILLTHGPPFGIFDRCTDGEDAGCENLRARLPALTPRIHLFGHIHEGRGAYIHAWDPNNRDELPLVQFDDEVAEVEMDTEETAKWERTVFVNAAAWPAGTRRSRDGIRMPFGGPGFQAVVVDLKE